MKERVISFMKQHGMHPDDVDMEACCETFQQEMCKGLQGLPSSLMMIPAYVSPGMAVPQNTPVISPMLITFLNVRPYEAVGIALASDVLASAVSAWTYRKNGNLDVKNGLVMMASVLCFTLAGSWAASFLPQTTMGSFSMFMTLFVGIKFIVRPVMAARESNRTRTRKQAVIQSILCGMAVGLICGIVGAGAA